MRPFQIFLLYLLEVGAFSYFDEQGDLRQPPEGPIGTVFWLTPSFYTLTPRGLRGSIAAVSIIAHSFVVGWYHTCLRVLPLMNRVFQTLRPLALEKYRTRRPFSVVATLSEP